MKKTITIVTAAILMTGCSTFLPHDQTTQSNGQLVGNTTIKTKGDVVGHSCQFLPWDKVATAEAAKQAIRNQILPNANITAPQCKSTGFVNPYNCYTIVSCSATIIE
jgi:hypothetical protein